MLREKLSVSEHHVQNDDHQPQNDLQNSIGLQEGNPQISISEINPQSFDSEINPQNTTGDIINPQSSTGEIINPKTFADEINPQSSTGDIINPRNSTGEIINPQTSGLQGQQQLNLASVDGSEEHVKYFPPKKGSL